MALQEERMKVANHRILDLEEKVELNERLEEVGRMCLNQSNQNCSTDCNSNHRYGNSTRTGGCKTCDFGIRVGWNLVTANEHCRITGM